MATQRRYHYTECGLDNIYLSNGFQYVDSPRGKAINIQDVEGLHRAIGEMLTSEKKDLDGKEFRFLRHEMNLTQRDLAEIIGVDVQSIARWEKGQTKRPIDGPAQGLLRVMYQEFIGNNSKIVEPLRRLAELDEAIHKIESEFSFEDTEERWQPSMAA